MQSVTWVTAAGSIALAGLAFGPAPATAQVRAAPVTTPTICKDGAGPSAALICSPRVATGRMVACDTPGVERSTCIKQRADRFCRGLAYTSSVAYIVTPDNYLAELLCAGKAPPRTALGTPPSPGVGTPPAQGSTPGAADGYAYATSVFEAINPRLVLSATSGTVTGSYTATQSYAELEKIMRTGTYGVTSGKVEGQFSGNVFRGYWYEAQTNADLQNFCENERNGTRIYGQLLLTFSADRKSFSGYRSTCDAVPNPDDHAYHTWTGKLTGRAAVAGTGTPGQPAAKPAATPAGPGALGNVYSTIDWGDLTITEWGAASFRADYTHEKGRIEGTRNGMTIEGYWMQPKSAQACPTSRGGTNHYGRMTFTFNAAMDAFEGVWGYCDEAPNATWNGNLTRRGAVASSAAAGTTARPAAAPAPAAAKKKPVKVPGLFKRLADRALGQAEDRAGAVVDEGVDKAVDAAIDPR